MALVDVIVSGHLCLDLLPQMAHVPLSSLSAPGQLSEVGPLDMSTGGVVSNTGLALHRLGVGVRLMATVGDDLIGQTILRIIAARDAALTQHITVAPGQPGSYTIILSPERVDRIFLHCPSVHNHFGIDNIDFALVETARLFHFGYPPVMPRLTANRGAGLRELYRRAQVAGAVTSLDMTLPEVGGPSGRVDWVGVLYNTLPHVDIFLPSIEETVFALRRADFDAWGGRDIHRHLTADYLRALADEILKLGPAVAGFKIGKLGIYVKTGSAGRIRRLARLPLNADEWANREVYAPAFEVNVAGTTGAGDSAYAGFLAALLRGLPPDTAARLACAVGACNVEAADATSGVRTWDETQARLNAGWPLRPERVPGF
ncbi:MAG: carbohydrate kinase family protein [Chloroflexi bacterium]|nr:carbohydrate kinase family protein [Chloroflexota bacterium]